MKIDERYTKPVFEGKNKQTLIDNSRENFFLINNVRNFIIKKANPNTLEMYYSGRI